MHILVIGKFYTEGFALHIAETLDAMGHCVRRFEPGFRAKQTGSAWHRVNQVRGVIHGATDKIPAVRARRSRRLWDVVERGPVDVVIVCHDFLSPNEVGELKRRSGAQVALWFPDALVNFGVGYFLNAPYDALFFKDPFILHALGGALRSPAYYLPECFNPHRHRLPPGAQVRPEYRCDVCTAGNMHSWRVLTFSHLSEFDVKMWGKPAPLWMPTSGIARMYQGSPVYNETKAEAFLGAKVVLNSMHYGEIWGLNVRAFEASGVGAFQMVDWRPGLAQLFEDGRELISFRGIEDLKHKLRYWLPRDDERREIAAAGMRRAYQEHTYRHRLDLLLSSLAGHERGFPVPKLSVPVSERS
jgi:spore maturation protein CgeB